MKSVRESVGLFSGPGVRSPVLLGGYLQFLCRGFSPTIQLANNGYECSFFGRIQIAVDSYFTHQRGIFPCFFGGNSERLVLSARRALITLVLVAEGSMIPSSSPRSAAKNGLATL